MKRPCMSISQYAEHRHAVKDPDSSPLWELPSHYTRLDDSKNEFGFT